MTLRSPTLAAEAPAVSPPSGSAAGSPSFALGLTAVCVAATAMVATLPGRSHGLGLITEPLLADLGIDRVTYGRMNLWATLLGALFCFPAGRLLDRFGSRVVLAATSASLGVVVMLMSGVSSAAAMFWLITLTRGLGQSALSVISIALVGKSFDRRAAWPMAVYSVLLSIGFMFAFPTVQALVASRGWRGPWFGIGATLVGFAVTAWFLLRRLPSSTTSDAAATTDAAPLDDGFTLGEAAATPIFWVFAGATSLFGLAYSGLGLFNQDVLAERGLAEFYGKTLAVSAPFGLLGQAGCGRLARRWSYQRLTTVALILYAAGLVGLSLVATSTQLYAVVCLLAVAGGMITVIFFAVWSRSFGHKHLGRIQGAAQMATVVASAVGPLVFAESRVRTGSYFTILYGLAAVVAAVGVVAWFTSSPRIVAEPRHVD
jgi:MFS family permease